MNIGDYGEISFILRKKRKVPIDGGCLCDLHPEYARINNWNHGIGRVETNEAGDFVVINFPLIANKMFF